MASWLVWCSMIGITSDEAREIAEAAGLTVIMDRCMGATHAQFGLGPGPDE